MTPRVYGYASQMRAIGWVLVHCDLFIFFEYQRGALPPKKVSFEASNGAGFSPNPTPLAQSGFELFFFFRPLLRLDKFWNRTSVGCRSKCHLDGKHKPMKKGWTLMVFLEVFLVCGPMAREPCGKIGSGVIMRAVGGCS